MSVRYPVLYLLSEIHNRDWDARLLIADYASALGFTSVVGQQWVMHDGNAPHFPPGLMLIKTVNEIQLNAARKFKNAGHLVVAMDEEALAVAPDQDHIGILSPRLPKVCEVFCANSPLHADAMERLLPGMKGVTFPTGNARLDLLVPSGRVRFAAEAEKIRGEYGPFVLFNSNLAQENSIWTDKAHYRQIQEIAGGLNPNDPASVARYEAQFEFERNNSKAFRDMLEWCLANITSHRIVVRPHPVERSNFWHEFAAKHPGRLHIAQDTHHIPWIMAADALVHTNSTTGLEAAFLERATVNLVPNATGHWENIYVGTRVNPTFTDWREGAEALRTFLTTGGGRLSQTDKERAELHRYFPGAFKGGTAERIARSFVTVMRERGVDTSPFNLAAHVAGKLSSPARPPSLLQKFAKTNQEAFDDLRAIRRVTGLSQPLNIVEIAESCFAIPPAA
jgi:surface carbohydrate biosynthesis protein